MKKSSNFIVCRKGIFLYDLTASFIYISCVISLLFAGAVSCKPSPKGIPTPAVATNTNTFKEKAAVKYAKGFTISYFDNYKLVKILNYFSNRADTLYYILVQKGTPAPTHSPAAQVIEIPVQKMVVTSSMHIGLAEYAASAHTITGLADFKYVSSPIVRKSMAAGAITEVGTGGEMNDELIISMQPDMVMTTGSPDAKFSRYQTLIGAGVPVIQNAEWLETDPLGRSEWVKLMAALTNQEALVNQKFERMEEAYNRLANLAAKAAQKPNVVVGMPFKGSWFVPDGDSYMAQFLKDAGASYHWAGVKSTGSLALDFETVSPVALTADFWLHPSSAKTGEDIAAKDVRYTYFKPYKQGTIYNNNKKVNDLGSNDYWESGAVNPHLILADLIKIFHPELLPQHNLVYYQQIK